MPLLGSSGAANMKPSSSKRRRCSALALAGLASSMCSPWALGWRSHGAVPETTFVSGSLSTSRRPMQALTPRSVYSEDYVDIWETAARSQAGEAIGLNYFAGSQEALWLSFFLVVINLPGVVSLVTRTGQAKYESKRLILPGISNDGFEMRLVAGGITSHFKSKNYSMQDAPKSDRIRFVGNLQGSVSQALYLTTCALGAIVAVGFVLQGLFPAGPLGLGPSWWYTPVILSPSAGLYYWGSAFRDDIVELQLIANDDESMVALDVFGDKETIEELQTGIRFVSPSGVMHRFSEPGMEFQPGMFDDSADPIIVRAEAVVA